MHKRINAEPQARFLACPEQFGERSQSFRELSETLGEHSQSFGELSKLSACG